jgi:glycerol kinase
VAYQTADLVNAMADDGLRPSLIRVDGGMVSNDWFLQFLSDVLGLPVERLAYIESTVLGAAFLAGLQCGVYDSRHDIESIWRRDRLFEPQFDKARRDSLYEGWQRAVARVRNSG